MGKEQQSTCQELIQEALATAKGVLNPGQAIILEKPGKRTATILNLTATPILALEPVEVTHGK